jgi:hypothetical protein
MPAEKNGHRPCKRGKWRLNAVITNGLPSRPAAANRCYGNFQPKIN